MSIPKITDDIRECYSIVDVIKTWIKVRKDEGYWDRHPPLTSDNLATELSKSRLFFWLLQGNEPLPLPPPLYASGPQHEMSRDGYFWISADKTWDDFGPKVMGNKVRFGDLYPDWELINKESDGALIVTMLTRLEGIWRIKKETIEGVGAVWAARRI